MLARMWGNRQEKAFQAEGTCRQRHNRGKLLFVFEGRQGGVGDRITRL